VVALEGLFARCREAAATRDRRVWAIERAFTAVGID
jgi:hypothetical protein